MHKFLKDYAQRHQVKVDFIEVEKHPESISRYGLRATPTVFIKNEPVDLSKITSFEDFEHLLLAGPKG
ncbi:hypothetical protein GCM10007895_14250 [Paraferrimonas sedimenticola]|uniref:Uncharacterized protein n=2 Tax=Paraferrimonas sedimenticola TaxID=375674 RepID=A0AA37RW75_9GAMM|nr:hypothetical protein GCM10007895_14250 [Paraferrimonas sedimenticola]